MTSPHKLLLITAAPALIALLLTTLSPSFSKADTVQTEEWQISAEKITRYEDPRSVIAEGNVELIKLHNLPPQPPPKKAEASDWSVLLEETPEEQQKKEEFSPEELEVNSKLIVETRVIIKADWVVYDVELGTIKARGNVDIKSDDEHLTAEEGTINLSQETGTFSDAVIIRSSKDLHLEGKKISKTGFNTYHIEDGWVVTCKVNKDEPPPWSFASKDTKITEGGYAILKHATFRIKGVPILYTPFMMLPAKNTRQTGFLFPEVSNSDRNGFGINLPFFFNISDSTDLTIYPEYFSDRGFMPGFEFRYIQDTQKKGTFMASYLDDKLSDPSETEYYEETGYTHTNSDRYWIRGKADHDSGTWATRLDLDIASDRDYLTEFNNGITSFDASNERFLAMYGRGFQNKTDDQRVNTLKILKSWSSQALEVNLLGINDTRVNKDDVITYQDPDDPDNTISTINPSPLWKLPSVDYSGVQNLSSTGLTLDWDADYVDYWRDNGVGAHRFDLFPRLSAPIPLGPYFDSRAEAGIRETFYMVQTYGEGEWDQNDTPDRFLYNFHAEIGTTFMRDFSLSSSDYSSWNHEFRPYITYDYLPDVDQDDIPVFDHIDRIYQQNSITYGIDNFFDLYKDSSGKNQYARDYAFLKIKQSYDLRSEADDHPFSAVNMRLRWMPLTNLNLVYNTDVGVYGEGVTNYGLESYYSNSRGDVFNLDYRYNRLSNIHQINTLIRVQILDKFKAAYELQHSLSEDRVIEQNISLIYQPACWSVELLSKYTPGDNNIMLIFNLANIGNPLGVDMGDF